MPLTFRIEYSSRAQKSLGSLSSDTRRRVLEKISELSENPFPRGVVKLHGEENTYRLRVGDFRVLYEVYRQQRAILIVKIEHRSTAYRG
ncbi:MAG: type II toxin-antitoxin system RelE/ParE family toxin [Thaumarchaeota archaeon]|nr:type II toxin-antitoxin system RelE/ParE family toxin [Nitrososphaerota archaeon]